MMLPKIIIICGPTGVGKTALSLDLAERFHGEIIVADSQATLKGFDIGTAKPTLEEQTRIPHHLIDVADFNEGFDAATFSRLAAKVIDQLQQAHKIPIICGGTGLYLKALIYGLMDAPARDDGLRKTLAERVQEEGLPILYQELESIDPERASQIHPNDSIRIIRALEIYHLTGATPSELSQTHGFQSPRYQTLKIGLQLDREDLYQRINDRVLAMLNHGWVEEVKVLMQKGYDLENSKTKTLGYPTLAQYVKGEIFIKEAIEQIQQETRQLAKRQMTWFRADPEIAWFHPQDVSSIFSEVKKFIDL